MSAPRRAVAVLSLGRAAYGAALLLGPARLLSLVSRPADDATGRVVARVLGARHVLQALLTGRRSGPPLLAAGSVVDGLHAATMLVVAARHGRHRVAALADGAVAAVLCGVGAQEARSG